MRLDLPDATIDHLPGFLDPDQADALLTELLAEEGWHGDTIRLFGREVPIPRLHRWVGDPGASYRWSGLTMEPAPWTPPLERLRRQVSKAASSPFNSCLLNLYRDGQDTMGMHADDEPELGPEPVIASLSLGETRDFVLKHRVTGQRVTLPLTSGSLLLMGGRTQACWKHGLPRRARCHGPRVNLTFRYIHPTGSVR